MRARFKSEGDAVQIYEPVIILKPDVIEVGDRTRIDSFTKIEGGQGVTVGRHVHICSFCHINIGGGRIIIGDGVGIASGAKIIGGTNDPAGESMSAAAPPAQQVIKRATTTLGRNAYVGTGAILMPGVTLGEGAVVGAGAVVTKDVPPWTIVAGVPARAIGTRARQEG